MTTLEEDRAALLALEADLSALSDRKRYRTIDFFRPYPKQKLFMDAGATHRERALIAANQIGKSETGAAEMAYHLTGLYPEGWQGRRWNRGIRAWADGETALLVRNVSQKKLCGEPGVEEEFGTGFIPRECFVDRPSLARGVTDAYDTIQVRHHRSDGTPDGISTLAFKSYEQGRAKHQGEPVDLIWCDEEPPEDVYGEIVTRITATKGMIYCTFTPLKGMSKVVMRYLNEPSPDRMFMTMTIEDAEHLTPEERAQAIAGYAPHERDARARGVPMMGSGLIFQFSEEALSEPAIPNHHIPAYWGKLWAVDFGIDHPFAAALLLHDRDNDIIHVHHTLRVKDQLPLQHASTMKQIAAHVPVAWPHDGNQRRDGGGGTMETLAGQYRKHGLTMLGKHATFTDGGYSTEAGISLMQERMSKGTFKVAGQLSDWWEEARMYHRKDGLIVKQNDDLMSATRIGVMAIRFAKPVALGGSFVTRRRPTIASGVDFDPWNP